MSRFLYKAAVLAAALTNSSVCCAGNEDFSVKKILASPSVHEDLVLSPIPHRGNGWILDQANHRIADRYLWTADESGLFVADAETNTILFNSVLEAYAKNLGADEWVAIRFRAKRQNAGLPRSSFITRVSRRVEGLRSLRLLHFGIGRRTLSVGVRCTAADFFTIDHYEWIKATSSTI